MKLVTFSIGGGEQTRLGALLGDAVLDLAVAAQAQGTSLPATMQALIDAGPAAWDNARAVIARAHPGQGTPLAAVRLHAPLPRPVRFRDCSLFLEHMEVGMAKLGRALHPQYKQQVIYYNTDNVHIFGDGDDILWPAASRDIDYELEWACIVGLPGKDVAHAAARDHIFGYTIFNDWSARDLQFPFMEAGLGPCGGKDIANSIGPCIATPDEFADPYALTMTARINGEVWSRGTTASMHWRFEDAIGQFSRNAPLVPGEIIGSGTVLNGCGFELDRYLQSGDRVELEIEGIGVLRNRVGYAAELDG